MAKKTNNSSINIKQLSEIIGVAPSTVSRVLSGNAAKYRIAAATAKRVMEKATELGYRPNYFAHSLNTGLTFNIGLIFANKIDSFLGTIMEGVEARLRSTKYQMVVATCENKLELEQEEIDRMFYRQVDGIIIYPSAPTAGVKYPTNHLKIKGGKRIPLVIIGREIDLDTDHILFSDYQAGRDTAERFLAAGCRRFAFITFGFECSANQERGRGFMETLKKHGIAEKDIHTIIDDGSPEPVEKDLNELKYTDGIWAVNSDLLIKYIYPLYKNDDISSKHMRSIGREHYYKELPFSFETIPMPAREMGFMAADTVLEQIKQPALSCCRKHIPWSR